MGTSDQTVTGQQTWDDNIQQQNNNNNTPNNDRYLDNREVEEMERRQRESMSPHKSQYVRLSESGSGSASDKVSFADLRKQKARDQFHSSGINITYTEHEKEDVCKKSSTSTLLQQRRDSQQQLQQQ